MVSKEELNKIAIEYHDSDEIIDKHIENICQDFEADWLLEKIDVGSSVLELGYGDGIITAYLNDLDIELSVLEGSEYLVNKIREKYNITIFNELFEEFEPQKKYDLILASHVMEHVDNPVLLMEKMGNWLTENGKLIIIVPNKESIHRQLAVIMGLQSELDTLGTRDLMVGHQRVYSFETLQADVESAGLSVLEKKGFFLKTLPNSMMLDYSQKLLHALNVISNRLPENIMANIGLVVGKKN